MQSLQDIQDLQNVVDSAREQISTLEVENARLASDLQVANAKLEEERSASDNAHVQSIQQIQKLNEENAKLKQEVVVLRAQLSSKKGNETGEKNTQIESLLEETKKENARLQKSLDDLQVRYHALEELHMSSMLPSASSKSPDVMGAAKDSSMAAATTLPTMTDPMDVQSMSIEELRYRLQSEHNQLDATTDYLRQIEDEIDRELEEHLRKEDLPPATEATHDKLRLLFRVLQASAAVSATNPREVESVRNPREVESVRNQREPESIKNPLEAENAYLRESLSIANRYLDRLVGDSLPATDSLQHLQDRFEVVCRRSTKLMAEYRALQSRVESDSPSRLLQAVQSLAEHMRVIQPGSKPNKRDLEEALQRMDMIVVQQMPLLAAKMKEYKKRMEYERETRKRLERRVKEMETVSYEGLFNETQQRITFFTTGLDSPTDLFGAMW